MVFASLALTAAITFTTYAVLGSLGVPHYRIITYGTGSFFFAFLSARMIYHFLRNEVVLSVHHGGIADLRHSNRVIGWENIRTVKLEFIEQEVRLRIVTWQRGEGGSMNETNGFVVDLSLLDADTETIVRSIERYFPVTQALSEDWR